MLVLLLFLVLWLSNSLMSHSTDSYHLSYFRSDMFFHTQRSIMALILVSLMFMMNACLPLEEEQPECFPDESCPLGTQCMAGICQPAPKQSVQLDLQCIEGTQCQNSLLQYTADQDMNSMMSSTRELDISLQCLVVLQSNQIVVQEITAEQEQIDMPLFESSMQAFLLLVDREKGCPDIQTYPQADLSDVCVTEQGCHFYLRALPSSIEKDQINLIQFTAEDKQCVSSTWITAPPAEQCDGGDNDCDGFVDEGVNCSTVSP